MWFCTFTFKHIINTRNNGESKYDHKKSKKTMMTTIINTIITHKKTDFGSSFTFSVKLLKSWRMPTCISDQQVHMSTHLLNNRDCIYSWLSECSDNICSVWFDIHSTLVNAKFVNATTAPLLKDNFFFGSVQHKLCPWSFPPGRTAVAMAWCSNLGNQTMPSQVCEVDAGGRLNTDATAVPWTGSAAA